MDQVPADAVAWSSLGLAYVEQARVSADPQLYSAAEDAFSESERAEPEDNFGALAGRAALAAARHDFAAAHDLAQEGLAINPSNPILLGALSDAALQLGRYDDAWSALQRMVDVRPDTASLARVSYSWELRGDLDLAEHYMRRALTDAPTAADRAFASYHLGDLALNRGDPEAALQFYEAGIDADPEYLALLEGRAKARTALGDTAGALEDYEAVTAALPLPAYVLAHGELLESLGRGDEAAQQYELFEVEQRLFESAGIAPDVDQILYEADHGDPKKAAAIGAEIARARPFVEVQDAYAWALHRAGRHDEASEWSDRSSALGGRSALASFHAGMIALALGDHERARRDLRAALDANPHFHPLHALTASHALSRLTAS